MVWLSLCAANDTTLGAALSSVKASALDAALTLPAASVWCTMTDLAPSPASVKLLPLPLVQLTPALVLYCQLAPASSPATLTVPTLVMLSAAIPLSVASVIVGAEGGVVSGGGGTTVSSVNAKAPELVLMLPATSVWRTVTDLAPSPVSVKLLPVPVVQLVPPLVLYCQLAPVSRPVTLTVPLLVMPSPKAPLSTARLRVGAAAVPSSVKLSALDAALTLPATSVWRTVTDLAPSPVKVKLLPLPAVQVLPPSVLYCQLAPDSSPVTLTLPMLVMLSVARPLLVVRLAAGAATVPSRVKASALDAALTLPATSVWRTVTDLAPSPVKARLLLVPASHVLPPSVLYCQLAPDSTPVTLTLPALVMLSVARPLLVARLAVGAAAVLSSAKASALDVALTLPAASVWRTVTVLAPSPLRVKLLPLPLVQLTPEFVLYCQVAPLSRPLTLTLPALVTLSVARPLLVASAMTGAAGAVVSVGGVGVGTVVSRVKASALDAALTLPAASVWRTVTDFAPSPVRVKLLPLPLVQVLPPLLLYCQVAPLSRPATLTVPTLVMPSPAVPLSMARVGVGAETAVSSVKLSVAELALTLPAASV